MNDEDGIQQRVARSWLVPTGDYFVALGYE
jgi:hypothetical protein